METNLSETDITIEIIPNVSAKCLVQDCYAPIPSGDLYVDDGSIVGGSIINSCQNHHMDQGGWHNKFYLYINGEKIGQVSASSACFVGMVNLD